MKILINAGHGGSDPGAVREIQEVDFNYPFAQKIINRIRELGGDVADLIDSIGGSGKAVPVANSYGSNCILLAIHANCCGGTGFESFYCDGFYSGKTQELVETIHNAYEASGLVNRGIKPDTATKVGRLTILRDTVMPSMLLEGGFVDNDAATLINEDFQFRVADVVARALMQVAGQGIVEPTPQPQPEWIDAGLPDGRYLILSAQSGMALDHNTATGEVILYRAHGGKNQQWQKRGAVWTSVATGGVLDIAGGSSEDGSRAIVFRPHGGLNQNFVYTNEKYLIARHSGKALDVYGGSNNDGTPIIQYSLHGRPNQQWHLVKLAE